jgi:hypothetical protein
MDDAQDADVFVAYLLGLLPSRARSAVEDLYFVDGDALELIDAIEHELAARFVSGELAAELRPLFEERYLGSDRGRELVALARLLQAGPPLPSRA